MDYQISTHLLRAVASLFLIAAASLHAGQGPVLSYPFNEGSGTSTADTTGNGNTGTLVNSPVWTSGPSGGTGALQFNGVNTYVAEPTYTWNGGPVTVSFWNFVAAAPTTSPCAFGIGTNAANRLQCICPNSDSVMYWDCGNPNGNGRITYDYTPFYGKWTHVTLVSAGAGGTYKAIYLNGQIQTFSVTSDSPQVSISPLHVGHSPNDAVGTNHFKGMISDFRIYNRVLADSEIAALMQVKPVANPDLYATSGSALSVPAPGVLSNDTDFNGVAITAVLDSTTPNGTLALNANGSFTYSANGGFTGNDTFQYHAVDGSGNASNSVTVTIQVPGNASVTAISPTTGVAGAILTSVTLTGTGFQKGAGSRPGNVTSFQGHDYAFVSTSANWSTAKANCAALGGHLPTLASAAENQFVFNLGGLVPAWIGFTDEVTVGNYQWVDGEPITYTDWKSGFPDGSSTNFYTEYSATGSGAWADVAGSTSLPYVCEFDTSVVPRVLLVGPSTIEGYNVRWNSASQVLFDINLTGAAGGKYFVELINPDGLVTVSPQLFSISPTRWHLTIPIPYTVQVTNTQTYTTPIPAASSGDATATISYMEVDATDTSTNQRLYDCVALLHTVSTFDKTTYSGLMGAGQLARYTNYPNPTMNLLMHYDFEKNIFGTDEQGNGMTPTYGRTTFNYDSTKTLWARFFVWRGDGNPGNTFTNMKLLVTMDCATMPGAYMTGNSQKTLQWTVSPAREAVAQKLYKASALAGPYALVTTINDNTTATYQDLTMQNGATTYYKVVAQTVDGTPGADSNVLTVALPNTLQVTAMTPVPSSTALTTITSVTATFSGAVNAAGVHAGSVKLVRAGPDGLFDTADDVTITPTSLTVVGTNQIKLDLTGLSLAPDKYRVSLTNGTNFSSTNLYAYWPMDEGTGATAADASGNNRKLTLTNTTWTTGVKNGGLLFNGSNSVAALGLADLTVPWTLTFFVNRLDTTNSWQDLMVTGSNSNRLRIEEYNNTKKVGFTRAGAGDYTYNYSTPTGVWTQLSYVAVSGSTSLYANGVLQGTINDSISLPLTAVGASASGAQNSLNGSLDEMRVYNRVLTATELYAASNGVSDLSGNALDGEFSGTFPSGDGLIGGNFSAQFTLTLPPLQVTAMTPVPNTASATQPSSILLSFNNQLTTGINYKNAVIVTRAGTDGLLGTADDVTIIPTSVALVGTTQLQVNLPAGLPFDKYQVRLPSLPVPVSLSNYAASSPYNIAKADMNGDTKVDFIVTSQGASVTQNPTIFTGNGTGIFSTSTPYTLFGNGLSNTTYADINGDGKMDLIGGSNGGVNTISIALNNSPSTGVLTFGAVTPVTMGNNCLNVQAADFNADGKPDLVTANFGDSTISVILNTTANGATTPTFSSPVTYNSGGSTRFIAIADINGDGKPDIVACNYGSSTLSVFLNTTPNNASIPSFSAPTTLNTDSQPYVVQCLDINGDGKPDLVVSCINANTLNVFMNTTATNASAATFGSKNQISLGTSPSYIATGDLDGDGKPDLAVTCEGSGAVAILINTTAALATTPSFATSYQIATSTTPKSVVIGDFTGNGDVGFAAVNYGGNSLTVAYPFARAVVDTSGNQLDGEFGGTFPSGNGVAGGDFVAAFTIGNVGPTTTTLTQPAAITYGTNSLSLTATVTASGTTVASGAVTFQLISGGNNAGNQVVGNVASGSTTVTYNLPAGSAPGLYSISASYNGAGAYQNSSDSSKQLTVNPAPLTITPNSFSRNYGSANPSFTGTITGLKNGDNITATYATSATAGSSAGNYSIVATISDPGNKLSNYALTQNSGTLTVNKVALSITANSTSRVYAMANPALTGVINGLVNNDNVTATYVTQANVSSPAASYAIVPSPVDPGNVLGNYALTVTNGALTVTRAPLTVTADSFQRTYGVANPTLTGTVSGVVNGDNITATYATSATTSTSVGNYAIVPTLADPTGKLGNYSVTSNNGVLTIDKAAGLLVVTPDSFTRVYGDTNPALTGTISGILNGDNITATYAVPATQVSAAGNYVISATLVDPNNKLPNYTVNQNVGQLTVSKAPLSVTGGTFARVYGAANPALSGTILGIKIGDNITATYACGASALSPVAAYPVVPTTVDPGNKLSNYNLTLTNGSLSVTAAPLSVTPADASRQYGQANPAFTGTVTGVLNNDGIGAAYATTATPATSIGMVPITATLTDPNNKAGNYSVTLNTGTLTISTAPGITVNVADAARAYGAANPVFSGTLIGVLNGDPIGANYSTTANAASPIGPYAITPTFVDPGDKLGNYAAPTLNTGTLTVGQAALTVTAASASRAYGAANPAFTGTITGIQNGDNITATYASSATPSSAVGPYAIVPTLVDPGNKMGNYSVTSTNGALTVGQAALTVTAANASRLYGAANPAFSGTITGIQNNDNISATYASSATPVSAVGPYAIVPTLVDPGNKLGNYSVTSTNGTLTVGQAALTVTAANASRLYGAANPAFTGTLAGIQNNDNITATYASSATPASAVGTYAIVPTLVDPGNKLGNYSVTKTNATLTVGQAALSVTAADSSRLYGAANPAFTGTITGIQNNDNITASYASSATPASSVGPYSIVPTLVDPNNVLGNYNVTPANGTLTVGQAPLTVTAANASRIYGAANPAFTGTITGIQNNDPLTATYATSAVASSPVGPYPIVPTLVDPAGVSGNYSISSNNGILSVGKATPVLTWPAPARIFAGVALSGTQLNAAASDPVSNAALPGTYAYATPAGTVLPPGLAQTLSVAFTPSDTTNYNAATANTTIDVDAALPVLITSALSVTTPKGAPFSYTITADGSAPMQFATSALPADLSLAGNVISGTPAASGVFFVALTASNYANSDTKTLVLTVTQPGNHAPIITSPPTVSANPATTSVPVTFSAQATDLDGDNLDYEWDFGDGTSGRGASVTKVFSAAGVYSVALTVSDGQASATQTVNVVVQDAPTAGRFTVAKVKLVFDFVKSGRDGLTFSGQIPVPAGFNPAGKTVRVLSGSLDYSGTLTAKGSTGDKVVVLKGKSGSGSDTFAFALKNQNLFAKLMNLGFSKTAGNPSLTFPVIVVLDGVSYFDHPAISYSVKSSKTGPKSGLGQK